MARPAPMTFAAVFAAGLCATPAHGQPADWPHVRGPGYDGSSADTGLADSWPAGGPPVLWERELGQGYSGFVIADGRAFTQFQSRTGQFVVALDPDTGAEVWRRRVGWPWQPAGAYPGPYATPTWHAGRVYYATPTGTVGCLDAAGGGEVWAADVRAKFGGRGTEFGFASTPLVEGGRVIVPVGGAGAAVVALNAADGSTAWTAGDDAASYCPAYPVTLGGKRVVVVFLRNALAAYDPETGRVLWRQLISRDYDEHSAWPLYAEPDLLVSAPFRAGARVFRLGLTDAGVSGKPEWDGRALSCDVCSPVLTGGHVYGFDLHQLQSSPGRPSRGAFKCLDFATGHVRWETDEVGQATALAADGKLILLDETGTLILARADPGRYAELGRVKVFAGRGLCWTPPAMWRGRVFVRNHARAACLFLGPPHALDPDRPRPPAAADAGPGFDWSRLVPREPDFPNDAPAPGEVGRWFAWCVCGVFGGAAVVAGLVGAAARAAGAGRPRGWCRGAFVVAAVGLGMSGTTALGAWADRFVLTWPAALYAAFRVTVGFGVWARDRGRRERVAARAALALFAVACYGYYRLCLAVGYVMAWGFLAGLLPAAPFALGAARATDRGVRAAADAAGFAVYFWASGLLPGWKDRAG